MDLTFLEKVLRVGAEGSNLGKPSIHQPELADKKGKRKKEDHRQGIINLLLSENLELLDAICTSSPTVDGAAVAMSIMVLLQQQQLAEAFIKRLLVRKLKRESKQGKDGITNLLRDNSMVCLLLIAFTQVEGMVFMRNAIINSLKKIIENEKVLEVNPSKEPNPEKLQSNIETLEEDCKILLKAIESCRTLIPPSIRRLSSFIKLKIDETLIELKLVDKKKPEVGMTTSYKVLASFMFLRYLIPAITNPEKYSLLNPNETLSDASRQNLILIAKVLTNLCNGVLYGQKETHLMTLNKFLDDNSPFLLKFLTFVSDPPKDSMTNPLRVTPQIMEASLDHVIIFLQTALPKLEKEIHSKTAPKEVIKSIDKIDRLRILVEKVTNKGSSASVRAKFKALTFKNNNVIKTLSKSKMKKEMQDDDDDEEEKKYNSLPSDPQQIEKPLTKSLSTHNNLQELEDEFLHPVKLSNSPGKRRGSILPGNTSNETIFNAELMKKKAEKHITPFHGCFELYLLKSDKMYGKYLVNDECIMLLGPLLSSTWEAICNECIRISLGVSRPKSSSLLRTPEKTLSPNASDGTDTVKIIDASIMETAIERTVPVSICHFSKNQEKDAMKKKIRFNRQDLQKDFNLLVNSNPWNQKQHPDVPQLSNYTFTLNPQSTERLATLLEYIYDDILQAAAGLLFSSNRNIFQVKDIENTIKSDQALKELKSLHEKNVDSVEEEEEELEELLTTPTKLPPKRQSRLIGGLALEETKPKSPQKPPHINLETKPQIKIEYGVNEILETKFPKSRSIQDFAQEKSEVQTSTIGTGKSRLELVEETLEENPVSKKINRKSTIIKRSSTSGPFHYIY